MNEEMINESELTDEELAGQKLCEENRRLREALFCAVRGIPEEYREDMALLARSRAEKNGTDFESAADEVFERYRRVMNRRSGTRMERIRNNDTALRRAFGLDTDTSANG